MPFDERLYILRRDQARLVTQLDHLTRPVMGAPARLKNNQTGRMLRHVAPELLPRQFFANRRMVRNVVDLKHGFCQIHPNKCILHAAVLSCLWLVSTPQWRIAMPKREDGNHTI